MALPDLAPAVIVVNRAVFTMKLIRYRIQSNASTIGPAYTIRAFEQSFSIAVGAVGHRTVPGEYRVVGKSATPAWRAPDWAEGVDDEGVPIAGQVFEFDEARNPFAGGFISFEDNDPENDNEGQGFHGVKFDPQLGQRASHGCVRMDTDDFKSIYEKVPIGTLVVIF